jgi:hypothetical protein
MNRRMVQLLLGCWLAGPAEGGARIDLAPRGGPQFAPGATVTMDIFLTQDPGGRHRGLRLLQFDFSDTDMRLTLEDRITFDARPIVNGFARYVRDREIVDPGAAPTDPRIVSMVYTGPDYPGGNRTDPKCGDPNFKPECIPWRFLMLVLPPEGTIHVADIDVMLPTTLGTFVFDVVNADAEEQSEGAGIGFGFGIAPNNIDPVTFWRPFDNGDERPELVGGRGLFMDDGQGAFTFIPEPSVPMLVLPGVVILLRRRRFDG